MSYLKLLKGKIKTRPEEFRVEEVVDLKLEDQGEYSYYKLIKRNINTFLALDLIEKYWKISRDRIGFCGLKDKRAITIQYISIKNGPEKDLTGPNFKLEYIGKGSKPLKLGDAKGNIFTITLKNINPERIIKNLNKLKEIGFANYFGEQRFAPDLYMKKPLVKYFLDKDYEGALKEYFTQHPGKKRILKKFWGNWEEFFKEAGHLSTIEKRVLITYIKKQNAEKVFKIFPKSLKLLFFFSYQSLLWNKILANFIKKVTHYFCLPFIRKEKICFYKELSPILKNFKDFELPFISSEVLNWDGPEIIKKEILKIIKEEKLEDVLEAEALGLKIFTSGKRKIIIFPESMKIINYNRKVFTFRFFLPSGSYATVFLLKLLSFRE